MGFWEEKNNVYASPSAYVHLMYYGRAPLLATGAFGLVFGHKHLHTHAETVTVDRVRVVFKQSGEVAIEELQRRRARALSRVK